MRKVIKIFAVAMFSVLAAAVFVPLAVGVAVSFPAVQNAVGRRVATYFSERLGTMVSVERFEVRRLNRVHVEGLFVADHGGDTLLYVPRLEAPVEQLPILGRPTVLGRVQMQGARMRIHRDSAGVVNIRELVRRGRGDKSTGNGGNVYINGISAAGIDFTLTRDDRRLRERGVDFSRFETRDTDVEISRLAVEGGAIMIGIEELRFVERTGWRVDRLRGELRVGRGSVVLNDVEVESEGAELRLPRIAIEGANWRSFRHFADSVSLGVEMSESRLGGRFLQYFVPAGAAAAGAARWELPDEVRLAASVDGPLGALRGMVESARIGRSELALEFSSRGLPDVRGAVFEGTIERLSGTGGDLARFWEPLSRVGAVGFAGSFAGSLTGGVEVAGEVEVANVDLGMKGLSPTDGEFRVAATLGGGVGSPRVKAEGTVRGLAPGGRDIGAVEVEGEWNGGWRDGGFSASVGAADPFREWGLNGALAVETSGTAKEIIARGELRNVVYVSPRGSVATPTIELAATLSADEKSASMRSEFADVRVDFKGSQARGEATLKNADALLASLAPGLQVAEGTRLRADFDTATHNADLALDAPFVEYRNVLLAGATLAATRRDKATSAKVGAEDFYFGSLHIPALALVAQNLDSHTRLSLDGTNYLTIEGLSARGVGDSLHIDLAGFDLAALGALTPKGTHVDGYVDIAHRRHISARLTARGIDAAIIEPFLGNVVAGTTGRADIDVRAQGEAADLRIDGSVELTDLASTVIASGVRYAIEGARIEVTDSRATLPPTLVEDPLGGEATLAMTITDTGTEITLAPRRLLAFDRQVSSVADFGGQLFVSGDVTMRGGGGGGGGGQTSIAVDVRTDRGTTIELPLSGRTAAESADFVTFITLAADPKNDPADELARRRQSHTRTRVRRRNIPSVDATLRVTDDARVEMTVDPRLGHGIAMRGEGLIELGLDPSDGRLSATGDYTITGGRFDFSMMDVLSRNFTIAPGSTIRWNGTPTDATLDLRALYRVRTSLAPLLGGGGGAGALVSDRANVPVDCVLLLGGSLREPAVNFDIAFPSADNDARGVAAGAMNTEELKSMQFLSLLVTGAFASAGSIGAGTGASTEALASGSVGFDILTNQLGSLLSSDDYDVRFRYRPEDNFLTNRFDMGFQAGFAGDRLRLEIEGNYVDDRAAASLGTQGKMGDLAGDVSLTWVIDESGNLRLKVFSQTVDRLNETQGLQESGLGVYWQKDFDRLGDIFQRKRLNLRRENTKQLK